MHRTGGRVGGREREKDPWVGGSCGQWRHMREEGAGQLERGVQQAGEQEKGPESSVGLDGFGSQDDQGRGWRPSESLHPWGPQMGSSQGSWGGWSLVEHSHRSTTEHSGYHLVQE